MQTFKTSLQQNLVALHWFTFLCEPSSQTWQLAFFNGQLKASGFGAGVSSGSLDWAIIEVILMLLLLTCFSMYVRYVDVMSSSVCSFMFIK